MEKTSLEKYVRNTACINLNEFDKVFADEYDFVEVCEWKNGEGFNIAINDRYYSMTRGELDAINYLVEQLNKNQEES